MTPDASGQIARPLRERLDVLIVAQGLAASRERAQGIILAGQILVDGKVCDKPGTRIPPTSVITRLAPTAEERYVSRGGLKLEHALDAFALQPRDLVALDIGASTGGFTDVLLQRGARRVYAIDVGQGQLAWQLREDPRVVVMERSNIRHITTLPTGECADCAVIDVSFISLRLVLPPALRLLTPDAWIVALIKPQFEAGRHEADRGSGVIRDPAVHRMILQSILDWCDEPTHGVCVRGLAPSPIQGREGNREYLIWLERQRGDRDADVIDLDGLIRRSFAAGQNTDAHE